MAASIAFGVTFGGRGILGPAAAGGIPGPVVAAGCLACEACGIARRAAKCVPSLATVALGVQVVA